MSTPSKDFQRGVSDRNADQVGKNSPGYSFRDDIASYFTGTKSRYNEYRDGVEHTDDD